MVSSCPWVGCTASSPGRSLLAAPTARRKSVEIIRLKAEGVKPSEIAKRLGVGRASVYRVLGEPQSKTGGDPYHQHHYRLPEIG
jgi:DNA invertase Pin-like site-specific DNA recombinase